MVSRRSVEVHLWGGLIALGAICLPPFAILLLRRLQLTGLSFVPLRPLLATEMSADQSHPRTFQLQTAAFEYVLPLA